MRRILTFLLLCLLLVRPGFAEDHQRVQCSTFSLQLPVAWSVDADEYSREAYPFLDHILHPAVIFAGDADLSLVVTLYNYPSEIRYRLSGRSDQVLEHFNVVSAYSGLDSLPGVLSPRILKALQDSRQFVMCQLPEQNRHLVSYYNPDEGLGYVFSLTRNSSAFSPDAADALLLEIISSLREVGCFYPADTTGLTVVITHPTAHIRTKPDSGSEKIKTASQGERFPHCGQTNGWYVINVDGEIAYVSSNLAELQ